MKILIVSADRSIEGGFPANLGDAFLTDALADALRVSGNDVDVIDFGDAVRVGAYPRLRASGLGDLVAAIRASDAVVVGGGTLLQDDSRQKLVGGLPRLCAVVALVARVFRRPVRFFGVGCDTVDRVVPRSLLRFAVSDAVSWVRETDSRDRFAQMFGQVPFVGADVSLLLDRASLPEKSSSSTAIIALNRSEGEQLSSRTIERLRSDGFRPQFLSMEQQLGDADYHAVESELLEELSFAPEPIGWQAAWDQIAVSSVVVASRMHALYMAALVGVPAVAVGRREKVVSFAEEFGIPLIADVRHYERGQARVADAAVVDGAVGRARDSLDAMLASLE